MSKRKEPPAERHSVAITRRTDAPELEGGIPLPEELTGRASGTDEDVVALFAEDTADHFADGFRGGSGDDSGSAISKDPDADDN
jgi:hypothetical protein